MDYIISCKYTDDKDIKLYSISALESHISRYRPTKKFTISIKKVIMHQLLDANRKLYYHGIFK